MSDTTQDSRVGSQFGPYQLNRLLGRGQMADVYEAEDTVKHRVVALKLISQEFSSDPAFRERMQREADALGKFEEAHVVPIHEYGEIDGQLFIDMSLIDGTDLGTLLKRFGPLSPPRTVAILRQIAEALDAAHAAGVMHRDVKPANILITAADFAYLTDFGIAGAATDERLTQMGTAAGTLKYMAPERLSGAEMTYRADLYSLACVLYECLTGSPPYRADSTSVLISAHLMQPIPHPSQERPGIPAALDEVIARGMAKNPDNRYARAGDLVAAAEQALSAPEQGQAAIPPPAWNQPAGPVPPPPTSPPVWNPPPSPFPPAPPPPAAQAGAWPGAVAAPPRRSRRWWWIGAALLTAIVLAAAGVTAVILTGRGGGGGARSPQAAVLGFLAAAERNDAFGAADLLDPDEQAGIRKVLDNFRDSAQRTGYQQGGGPNGLLQGVQVSTDNVQTSVTNVRDDLARVTFTGGQITLGFDADNANAGLQGLVDNKDRQRTWSVDQLRGRSESGQTVEPAAMTVRRGGKWYVSLLYSGLDATARYQDNGPVDPGNVDTQTFSSPEAAAQGFVDGFVSTLTSASIMPVAKTLSPDAGVLLATYRPLLERKMQPQRIRVLATPQFSAATTGDTATVTIDDLQLQYTDSDGSTHDVGVHGDCITVKEQTRCNIPSMNVASGLLFKPRGVIATKGGNGWHIDPVATYLNGAADLLHNASKEDVALALSSSVPKAFLRLDAQGQLQVGQPNTFTLSKAGALGFGFAVFDLPVRSGQQLGIAATYEANDDSNGLPTIWMAVGKSGMLARGSAFDRASDVSGFSAAIENFTAPDTETAKVVVWGPPGESVILGVAPQ